MLAVAQRKYETILTKIKNQQKKPHNERGAGRKRRATKEVIQRVIELREEGLSQQNIVHIVSDELGISISRTTVSEIVRGEHDAQI